MLFLLSSVVTTLANLFLGIFVFLRNPKSKTNLYFLALAISLGVWAATLYLYYTVTDPQLLLLVGRVNFVAPTLAVYFLCMFVYLFPQITLNVPKNVMTLTTISVVVISLITLFTPYVDQMETAVGSQRFMTFGLLYPVWAIVITWLMAIAIAILYIKRRSKDPAIKSQIKYLTMGLALAFIVGTTFNIILPYLFDLSEYQMFGPLGTLALTGFVAYAMRRHRFLDVSSLVFRTLSYTILLVVILLIEVTFVWVISYALPIPHGREYAVLLGALAIIFSYDYLRDKLSHLTAKYLFKNKYDSENLLRSLTEIMASEIQLEELSLKLLTKLRKEMGLTKIGVLFRTEGDGEWYESGFDRECEHNYEYLHKLLGSGKIFIFEELKEGELKSFMRENKLSVIARLVVDERETGLLVVGLKSSGDVFFEQDIEMIDLFVHSASLAWQNAFNYQEISQFNRTLTKKVNERTRELESEQKEKLKKAAELLKLKDEFVFIATHDLASPITAISGYADLIRTSKEKMSKDLRENMEEIVAGASRLKDLVDDLLQVARSDSGTIKVNLSQVDITEVIESVRAQVAPRAANKGVKFTVKLDDKHKLVMGDRDKLFEVFENLFTNAVKYNKPDGRVSVNSFVYGTNLTIEVEDTGYGIPKAEQERVFSKFYRSDSREIQAQVGTGLGLFVVKMLVSKMGGHIFFKSEEGKGTKFTINLKSAS